MKRGHDTRDTPVPGLPGGALACFPPVLDTGTRILILGSFPGVASLAASQYYAHPRNQFWRLLSAVLEQDFVSLAYPDRLRQLQAAGIGLWDVIAACAREGSLDSAIRDAQPNDLDIVRHACPQLRRVCFNGKTAGRAEERFRTAGYDTLVLPSSSPANAQLTFEQKLMSWRGIIGQAQS